MSQLEKSSITTDKVCRLNNDYYRITGTDSQKLEKSTDYGKTWSVVLDLYSYISSSFYLDSSHIYGVYAIDEDIYVVYANFYVADPDTGFYRFNVSHDGGITWHSGRPGRRSSPVASVAKLCNDLFEVYCGKITNLITGSRTFLNATYYYFDSAFGGDCKDKLVSTGCRLYDLAKDRLWESSSDGSTFHLIGEGYSNIFVFDGDLYAVKGDKVYKYNKFRIKICADDTLTNGDSATLQVSLIPGNLSGHNADWWLGAKTPSSWYSYDVADNSWKAGTSFLVFQGPLFRISALRLPVDVNFPEGDVTFYFGIDTNMDGVLDADTIYDDAPIEILPQSSGSSNQ